MTPDRRTASMSPLGMAAFHLCPLTVVLRAGGLRPRGLHRRLGRPEEGLDQGTVGKRPVRTLDDHVLEHSLHGAEVLQFHLDVAQVGGSQGPGLRARALPTVGESQESPDFIQGEPEITRTAA